MSLEIPTMASRLPRGVWNVWTLSYVPLMTRTVSPGSARIHRLLDLSDPKVLVRYHDGDRSGRSCQQTDQKRQEDEPHLHPPSYFPERGTILVAGDPPRAAYSQRL